MAMSLPLARTVICAMVALITVPSNFGGCGPLCGLMVSMIIGTAASATGTGTCAFAAAEANAQKPVARTQRSRTDCDASFMRLRGSFHLFGGDAQRFQEANILCGHGEFAAGFSL